MITPSSIANDEMAVALTDLPSSYNEILAIIPIAAWPNSTWDTYVIAMRWDGVGTTTIVLHTTNSAAQTYTLTYVVLYK